jgi:hypothetical protein
MRLRRDAIAAKASKAANARTPQALQIIQEQWQERRLGPEEVLR